MILQISLVIENKPAENIVRGPVSKSRDATMVEMRVPAVYMIIHCKRGLTVSAKVGF